MSATIRDVARRAGVSTATVSRVLNGTCPVHEDKRRLVLDASRALGYTPNLVARSLLSKKTGGLGVLLPFVGAEFFSEFLTGLDEAAQETGFFLMISTSHRHTDEFDAAMQAMDKRVDGMVIMAPELQPRDAASISETKGPVVFVNTYVDDPAFDVINFDNYGGGYALTQHLLGLGHRRIALIKGPVHARDAEERTRGYRAAMAEAGFADTSRLEYQGEYTREGGYGAARVLLCATPRPTAIVAANDYCAIGVMRALHEAGIAMPEEMAVAGFDGIGSTQYTLPPLTSVHVPMREIGYRAIRRLAECLENEERAEPPLRHVTPVELVVRKSTASPAEGGDG
ncbi:MAG: LacI family DNA-binding transcriptional regulator [Rhodothermales bacterium]